jgi:putative transposase
MARKHRIHFPYALYHVIVRGNNRQKIFCSSPDMEKFLSILEESVEKLTYKIHAFCLMPNHVHIALQIGEEPLGKIMQNISYRYARWFNTHYGCIGHLFQGRYRAQLIQEEEYLLALCKYIHLNPVCAKIVSLPEQYAWSSHNSYMLESHLVWLTTDFIYAVLLKNSPPYSDTITKSKVDTYKNYIISQEKPHIDKPFLEINNEGKLICNDEISNHNAKFFNAHLKIKVDAAKIIDTVCTALSIDSNCVFTMRKDWKLAQARAIIARCVQEFGDITLEKLAIMMGRDASTLSNAIMRLKVRQKMDYSLNSKVIEIIDEIQRMKE